MPRLTDVLLRFEQATRTGGADETAKRREWAKETAALAQTEVDRGFPLLHAQAVLTLWGSLEDLVRALVGGLLQHDSDALQVEEIQRLKVRVGDLLTLEDVARAEFLVEQLDRDLAGSLRQGVGRFEALLQPFGLSGRIGEELGRTLFELQQVRNLHAHRQGYADRRFCSACPWLDAEEGSYYRVTEAALEQYFEAVFQYVLGLAHRIGARQGWTKEEMDALEEGAMGGIDQRNWPEEGKETRGGSSSVAQE